MRIAASYLGLKCTATELAEMSEEQFMNFRNRIDLLMVRSAYWNLSRASVQPLDDLKKDLQARVGRPMFALQEERDDGVESENSDSD